MTAAIWYFFVFLALFLVPIYLVVVSKRCNGREKNIWIVITLMTSWVGWLLFVTTVPKSK